MSCTSESSMLPASAPHLRQLKQPDAARKKNFLVYNILSCPMQHTFCYVNAQDHFCCFACDFSGQVTLSKCLRGACGHLQVLGQAQAH